jgi:GNAT superfamily N-acetyltransferase
MASESLVRVRSRSDLRAFVAAADWLQRDDPLFIPPLHMQEVADLDPASNPFFRHAESAFWLLLRDGRPAGRISATVDALSLAFHADHTGVFGHFEAVDAAAAARLVGTAAGFLRARGIMRMRGPVELSTNYRVGCLVEGFDIRPSLGMNHNPPGYGALLEGVGLRKAKDLLVFYAYRNSDFSRILRLSDVAMRRAGATERALDETRFAEEAELLNELYNRCWERNWGFAPMSEAEFHAQARALRPIFDADLCRIVEIDGKAVGFILAVPDINPAVKACGGRLLPFGWIRFERERRICSRARVLTLGLLPEARRSGLDGALIARIHRVLDVKGYEEAELSWVLEDNLPMVKPLQGATGAAKKRYRVYEMALG